MGGREGWGRERGGGGGGGERGACYIYNSANETSVLNMKKVKGNFLTLDSKNQANVDKVSQENVLLIYNLI